MIGAVPSRLADLPLAGRERLEAERQRELQDGLTRRHLDIAGDQQRYAAAQPASLPELAAKLRGK